MGLSDALTKAMEEGSDRFELVYSTGGHGGPYKGEKAARAAAERLLKGGRDRWIAVIPADQVTNLSKAEAVGIVYRDKGWEKGRRRLPSVPLPR